MDTQQRRQIAETIWWAGTKAVTGNQAVTMALASLHEADGSVLPSEFDCIIAVGKAGASMMLGALRVLSDSGKALVVTKYDHTPGALKADERVSIIEAGHPVPDENSLKAGAALTHWVSGLGRESRLLFLVSGGASALAENLVEGKTLSDLTALNKRLLSDGSSIEEINRQRYKLSNIKDGKLLAGFGGSDLTVLSISDVPNGDLNILGSGIGMFDSKNSVQPGSAKTLNFIWYEAASNKTARDAAFASALSQDLPAIENSETLYEDVVTLSKRLSKKLIGGPSGVYIFGGEPTIYLPDSPGEGGRNQSLALHLAKQLSGQEGISVIVAGTDGTDGPTRAAGGIIDGATWRSALEKNLDPQTALDTANAGPLLEAVNCLFITGPTGTNVMDLVVAVKSS